MLEKLLNLFKRKKKKEVDVTDNIETVNKQLLNLKIHIEDELEYYVMNQFVQDARDQNMLN